MSNELKAKLRAVFDSNAQLCEDFMNMYSNVGSVIKLTDGYHSSETESMNKLREMGLVATTVDNYGGEDEGSTYYHVVSFKEGDDEVFIKFDGSYASYDGATYNEWLFVEPKQVLRTEYS